jgi:hypothetical protein
VGSESLQPTYVAARPGEARAAGPPAALGAIAFVLGPIGVAAPGDDRQLMFDGRNFAVTAARFSKASPQTLQACLE